MKRAIYIFFLLLASRTFSQQIKIEFGSLAIHTIYSLEDIHYTYKDITEHYIFNITKEREFSRVVLRPQIGITYQNMFGRNKYYQAGVFLGQDCLHGDIAGFITGVGITKKYYRIGFIAGVYFRDRNLWSKNQLKATNAIPLIGIDVAIKKEFEHVGIELCNKLTPFMTVHNVSLTYKF